MKGMLTLLVFGWLIIDDCRPSEVSVRSCQWNISPTGQMSCYVTYGRKASTSESGIKDNGNGRAICRWSTSNNSPLSQMQRVVASCDFNSAAFGAPVLDADTFKSAVNLHELDIRNTPLAFKLPSNTFCSLSTMWILAIRYCKILDLTHIGLGDEESDEECRSAVQLKELWLSNNDISVIGKNGPLRRLKQLQWLSFDNNRVQDIDTDAFVDLDSLKYLFLTNNSLTHLHSGTFRTMKNLLGLDLEGNRLRTIDRNTFVGLDNLLELFLNNNELTQVNSDTFACMAHLNRLELSNNNGVRIADGTFAALKSLQVLRLNTNELTESTLSKHTDGLQNLKQLQLSHNDITVIDASVFGLMSSLQILFLTHNRLQRLKSGTFVTHVALAQLELQSNRIEVFEDDVFAETNVLQLLRIGANLLTDIPNLRNLKKLKELDLSANRIVAIRPDAFADTTSLEFLSLGGNRLRALTDHIFRPLSKLLTLDLAANLMTHVGNETFAGLADLKVLLLQDNRLNFEDNIYESHVHVPRNRTITYQLLDVFLGVHMAKLNFLNLSANSLHKFRYYWFPVSLATLDLSSNAIEQVVEPIVRFPTPKLTRLDLSRNAIETIGAGSFPFSVETLMLDHNHVSHLNNETFKYMLKLKLISLKWNAIRKLHALATYLDKNFRFQSAPLKFRLRGNPLLCDCSLAWIRTGHHKGSFMFAIEDYAELTCDTSQSEASSASLIATVAEEDFMCSFDRENLMSRSCLLSGAITINKFCNYVCPRQCRCSHTADWTWVTLACSDQVMVPGDIPLTTTVLHLDGNDLTRLEVTDLQWLSALRRVYLNANVIETVASKSFADLRVVERLHLDHNSLSQLDDGDLFANLKNLVILDLSHNRLSNLSAAIFEPLSALRTVRLNDNLLVDYPVWTAFEKVPTALSSEVSLQANPWSCDCQYAWSYRLWITHFTGKLVDKQNLYCVKDGHVLASLITFNVSDCYDQGMDLEALTRSVKSIYSSSAAAHWYNRMWVAGLPTIAIIVVALFVFVYRHEMQVLIYSRYGMRLFHNGRDEATYDANKVYDAFVSYSTLDEAFVVRELLPGLEHIDKPYSLCLHHRDFPIGAFINESIFDAIATSRRTILILSENFVRSEWCRFEFRTAHSQMLIDRCKRVIVIVYGRMPDNLDAEMKLYLRTNTYLAWGDRLFWKKLYFVLPSSERPQPAQAQQ